MTSGSSPTESVRLRVRREGEKEASCCDAPFARSGRLIEFLDDEGGSVVMQAGRERIVFFVEDFIDVLGGSASAAFLLSDAVRRLDWVEIRLRGGRLYYRNEAQYTRVCAQEGSPGAHENTPRS